MTSTFDGNITIPRLYALCGVSTLIWSVYPTVIVLSGGSSSIWFQIALLSLSISCFFWFYLKKTNRYFVSKEAIKYGIKEIISNRGILFVQRFGLVGYLLVAAYADPAVAAVLMETCLMWYFVYEFRKAKFSTAYKIKMLFLLLLGVVGVAGVVYSQYGSVSLTTGWIAALCVIVCACLQGINVGTSLEHGNSIATKIGTGNAIYGSILAVGLCTFVTGSIALCIHIAQSVFTGSLLIPSAQQLAVSIPAWIILPPWCFIALRKVNHYRTDNQISINLIYHAAAPLSLTWLWISGQPVYHPRAMIAGTILIIAVAFLGNITRNSTKKHRLPNTNAK